MSLLYRFLLFLSALFVAWGGYPCCERFFYPCKYQDFIRRSSQETKISPYLLASVIMAESSFKDRSRSSVGALGLMQLMPDTAWWVADSYDIPIDRDQSDILLEPEVNIDLGAHYLAWLSERFADRKVEVLSAYNIGQHEVDRWLLKDSDGSLTVDDIPVIETKLFVKKVLKNEIKYHELYPELSDN